jgi:hypothetical protein
MWWGILEGDRAQSQIDHLASGSIATDWGARILSANSQLYDPLSYHYGSVWPLFTGWSAMAAYRYGRPHAGYQALMANALLTYDGALGYVTELLSGDFNAPFGRSSHHQVWSEAMVVTPVIRGLLGIEVGAGGNTLTIAPQLPADWEHVAVNNIAVGSARYAVTIDRQSGRRSVRLSRRSTSNTGSSHKLLVATAFPLDARVRSVMVNGRATRFDVRAHGDQQLAEVVVNDAGPVMEVVYVCDEGTEVMAEPHAPSPGATNRGLRILRSRAEGGSLRLLLEGLSGVEYRLTVRTGRRLGDARGVRLVGDRNSIKELQVSFEGPTDKYVRREIVIPLS